MSTDPEQIREDIERTRAELSSDVDALTDKVSPSQVVHRQTEKVRTAVGGVKDRVMGSTSDAAGSASQAAHDVRDRASGMVSSVGDTAGHLPQAAKEKAQGNPLAAGLVAFGIGWLVSSLMPASRKEQELARTAKEQAAPLVEGAKGVAQDVAGNLKETAQEAATAVKDRATEAGQTLRQDGQDAAADLKSQAGGATQDVRGAHAEGSPTSGTGV
ncbi:DUF3618 domain-containing protein [Cellulomonas sp. H30R-01]|uniref:DUF3618 domain-containing protein n=1 Tax=Cellulomonas sp. H30R-01 TaxID=2704467 RepID=UPI00138B6980|nr:DUF3618 domain-containing protein [Cellulomonas sp. H30R-01]QHT55897.1 DUF3618 domain-containing protein [Cellulomonas sp. H30R-01]